jgi:hypothetical protein
MLGKLSLMYEVVPYRLSASGFPDSAMLSNSASAAHPAP